MREYAFWSLALAALVVVTRWPLRSQYLFSWDGANFARALDYYNVAFHRPHPPGYPLYVGAAWLVRPIVRDANTAYVVLSLAASIGAAVLLLGLAWRLYGPRVAVLATALFVASPNTWGHGEVAYPYAFLAFGALAVAWSVAETRFGQRDLTPLGAALLGLAGGFRPDLVFFLLPVWLWASYRREPRALVGRIAILSVVTAAWLVPMVEMSGGISGYITTLTDYAEVWGTPIDSGPVAFSVGVGRNVAELAGFAARSVGPMWGILLLVAAGRFLSPRSLASDARLRFLALWITPATLFYIVVHIGNLGYLLSVLPAAAIIGALTAVEVGQELVSMLDHPGPILRNAAEVLVGISCLAETSIFLFSRGPVSLAEIHDVDARLSITLTYLAARDPDTTLILAYDRFAQLQYYLTALDSRQHIRSLDNLLGPNTLPINRREIVVPPGIHRVILPDLDVDSADRPTGLQRIDLGHGAWVYIGTVDAGARVRVGYGFARVAAGGLQAQQNLPAGP